VEVLSLHEQLICAMRESGMDLKKWSSNSTEILNKMSPEDLVGGPLSFELSSKLETKVLGMQWSPRDDTIT
jgi:hypothetical protein